MTGRLVCVSNRVSLPRQSPVPGGRSTGILGALRRSGGIWFGSSGELSDGEPGAVELNLHDGISYATIEVRRDQFQQYYEGFSNNSLWPLFHYMPSRFRFCHEEYAGYDAVNRQFAARLEPLLKPDDCIWVHDYHLIPMARCLRHIGVRSPLGFFLHTPFPSIETLRVLPTYTEIIRDLACYDVVGFQTAADLQAFLAAIAHAFGEESVVHESQVKIGRRVLRCGVFPMGVDVDEVQEQAVAACTTQPVRRMIDSLHGRRLIIGVDRLDYSKGLVERFAGYRQFLETFPQNCGRVTLMQIAPALARTDPHSHGEIRRSLEQAAGRTNGRFAETDWTPIRYLNRTFQHNALMGFLRAADVALVTPLRDGMNLVAKEFLAAQDPEDPGVLVLSNMAGAACELTAALQINPYDPRALGHALQAALAMPLEERRDRHTQLLMSLRERSMDVWADRFLAVLRSTRRAPYERKAS